MQGQSSRVFGYTGADATADVMLEIAPDASSTYSITRCGARRAAVAGAMRFAPVTDAVRKETASVRAE